MYIDAGDEVVIKAQLTEIVKYICSSDRSPQQKWEVGIDRDVKR